MLRVASILPLLAGLALPAVAAPPRTMSYQGILTNNAGAVVPDATYSMTFRIHDAATGGSALWTEVRDVAVSGGHFSVILGKTNPITIDFGDPRWLSVAIATDPELTPRIELAGSPYSLTAGASDWIVSGSNMYSGVPGNVGIGTTTPAAKLDVVGTAAVSGNASVGGNLAVAGAIQIPTTTRYLSIPAEGFNPDDGSASYSRNTLELHVNTAAGGFFGAAVHLPHGAVVTQLSALVEDASASHRIVVSLRRIDMNTPGAFGSIVAAGTTGVFAGGNTVISNTPTGNATIDNQNFAYAAQLDFDGGASLVKLRTVRIAYQIAQPLP